MGAGLVGRYFELISRLQASYLSAAKWQPGVVGFGGYGSTRRARVFGRVLMARHPSGWEWLTQKRGWRQFFDIQVPRHPALIQLGDSLTLLHSDQGGYIDAALTNHNLERGWHTARVYLVHRVDYQRHKEALQGLEGQALAAAARQCGVRLGPPTTIPVRIVGDEERVGIISDIDDTVMITMVPRPLLAVRHAFVHRVSTRQAVPGMRKFLRSLQKDAAFLSGGSLKRNVRPPFIYLSTGAWNTITVLRHFLKTAGFPKGTLLLRAWWFSGRGAPMTGQRFKLAQLEEIVAELPHVRWILVGDNGQKDPDTYSKFARAHPDLLAAIVIRTLRFDQHLATHGFPVSKSHLDRLAVPAGVPVITGQDGYELLAQSRTTRFRSLLGRRLRAPHRP